MALASVDDAIALYGSDYVIVSFDRDGNGVIDTAAAELHLDVATATIYGYLKGRIALPLQTVPADMKKYCIDIAIHDGCPRASVMTQEKKDRYQAAQAWLRGIRDNKIVLVDENADRQGGSNQMHEAEALPMHSNTAEIVEGARLFTRETLSTLI